MCLRKLLYRVYFSSKTVVLLYVFFGFDKFTIYSPFLYIKDNTVSNLILYGHHNPCGACELFNRKNIAFVGDTNIMSKL